MRLNFFLEALHLYHKTLPISSTLLKTRKSPILLFYPLCMDVNNNKLYSGAPRARFARAWA